MRMKMAVVSLVLLAAAACTKAETVRKVELAEAPSSGVGANTEKITKEINPENGVYVIQDRTFTLKNTIVRGGIDFYGEELTLENVIVEGGNGWWGFIVIREREGILRISDSTIRAAKNAELVAAESDGILPMSGGSVFADRVDISGSVDGLKLSGDSYIRNSRIHDLRIVGESHNDGIQITGGGNMEISNNEIVVNAAENFDPAHHNSAVFIQALSERRINATISGNCLRGGGYTVAVEAPATVSLTDNRIGDSGYSPLQIEDGVDVQAFSDNTNTNSDCEPGTALSR